MISRDTGYKDRIQTLVKWVKDSNYTTIFTGAGMSTESGIPDFRSKDGLWRGIDPMTVATADALANNYDLFHEFYKARLENLVGSKPHKGYEILARWEKEGLIQSIATQNVDGFHKRAGNKKVYELHGSINSFRCSNCNERVSKESFMKKEPCPKCQGTLRPSIVLFGEMLPQDELNGATREMEKADLVIVIGTSLSVYPVNSLPGMTKGRKVYINQEIMDEVFFDLTYEEKAGQVLEDVDHALRK
jgi:NAD-dependent deacetylase